MITKLTKRRKRYILLSFSLVLLLFMSGFIVKTKTNLQSKRTQPNILWIITDDHRPDALACYNEAVYDKKESPLGFVSSPNIDRLADEGVLFTNAYCNAPVCGPSRGSMISGRYPFRTGHFAFDLTHQNPDFVRPSFPQVLQKTGYQTAQFGKTGEYIYKWGPGQGFHNAEHYEYIVHFKHSLQKNNVGDLWGHNPYEIINDKVVYQGTQENVKRPDGRIEKYYVHKRSGEISTEDIKKKKEIEKEFEILRSYTRSNPNLIIGGENPMPANQTIDAKIVDEFQLYLNNQDAEFTTSWGKKEKGANSTKPQLINLAFHLPHTPVLPPKKYRDVFKKIKYTVPNFDKEEYEKLPPQLKKMHDDMNMTNMTDKEIQQAIQDYYAFCAHGDELIGEAIRTFKEYCKKNNQEYVIVFTVGDHGWHLGEQGIEAKFSPWQQSTNGAIIIASSDKTKVPQGKVKNQLIEYVDIAPTILSASGIDVSNEKYEYLDGMSLSNLFFTEKEQKAYILGETKVVVGPRAYLRSNDFAFSMRSRPVNEPVLNKNVRWGLEYSLEDAELALYDLRTDPLERNNVAYDPAYKELAIWFRNKLGNIVLGDGRVECDWSKANTYSLSNFAEGSDDKVLNIPQKIIPSFSN